MASREHRACPRRLAGPASGPGCIIRSFCENRSALTSSTNSAKRPTVSLTRRESPLPNGPALLLPLSYARRLHRFADPPVLQIETVVRKATASPFGQERRGTLEALAHRLDIP